MTNEHLKLRIIEDHQKLDRVFTSVQNNLRHMEQENGRDDPELLEDVRDDLRFALEEMLEHFGIEEEAIFSFLKDKLPDLNPRIAQLEQGHEVLCQRTSRLRMMVAAAEHKASALDLAQARELVKQTTEHLKHHNQKETQIFIEALRRLDEDDRQHLLEALNSH